MNHAFSCKKRSKKEIRLAHRWCYTVKETEGSEQNQSLIFLGCHEVWAQATPSFGAQIMLVHTVHTILSGFTLPTGAASTSCFATHLFISGLLV